jgi:hypothetical protein
MVAFATRPPVANCDVACLWASSGAIPTAKFFYTPTRQ